MLKSALSALQNFAANEKPFHNPVTAKDGALLSTKEKIKGRVIPAVMETGILGIMSVMMVLSGQVATAAAFAVLSVIPPYVALAVYRALKFRRCQNKDLYAAYDFTKADECKKFQDRYPHLSGLPEKYVTLSKEMALESVPVFYVGKETGAASANRTSLFNSKPYVVFDPFELSRHKKNSNVLETCAHEFGHLKRNHSLRYLLLKAPVFGTSLGMSSFIAADLAITGGLVGALKGVLLAGSTFIIMQITSSKWSQYNEREADRMAAVATGMVKASAMDFHAEHLARKDVELPKDLKSKFRRAYKGLTMTHPLNHERAAYLFEFEEKNKDFCKRKSEPFRT